MSSPTDQFRPDAPQMDDPVFEEEIRQEAYLLWDGAGRPAGRDLEFWYMAIRARVEMNPSPDSPGIEAAGRPRNVSAELTRRRG
jgi:hypothetical protein